MSTDPTPRPKGPFCVAGHGQMIDIGGGTWECPACSFKAVSAATPEQLQQKADRIHAERQAAKTAAPQHPDHGSAGFCTDHGQAADRPTTVDTDAIRARAEDFREAIEASSDRVGVRAIKSARDVPDLLAKVDRLRGSADAWWTEYDRELTRAERLAATVARVEALAAPQWRSIPSDLPDATAEAYSRGRNDTLDAIRDALGLTVTDTPTEGGER